MQTKSHGSKSQMNRRRAAQAAAVLLSCAHLTDAQIIDRSPQVTMNNGFLRGEFRSGFVSEPNFNDSTRIGDLIRAGQLYLSLQDAIALALENNLDLELQRFGVRMATTDTYRAKGGGTLRGV